MTRDCRIAPAAKWRAFFILGASVLPAFAAQPVQRTTDYAQVGLPDAAKVRQIVEDFQQAGIAGQYYLEFELRILPRRGDERLLQGKLWGTRNDQGAISRVSLTDAEGRERRWLMQNGPRAAAWSFAGKGVAQLGAEAWLEPLVPGVDFALFDLQMPYLYWPDHTLEKIVPLRGRPTHVFLFRPPAAFAAQNLNVSGVRVYLDTQFNAPVQTELLGRDGKVLKTLSLVDLKRVGDQMIPKSIDARNEITRDKTRFQVTGVARGLDFAPPVFQPAMLAEEVRAPAPESITPIAR
jgi:Outer membrane lipoprotein-sorting protein